MADLNRLTSAIIAIKGKLDPSVKKSVDKATGSMKKLKVAAVAGAAAIGSAAIASGKYLLDLGSEMDGAYDAIRIGTGATGKALEGLKGDFEKVFKSMPTTSENAATAIADFNTRLGLSGKTLQEVSKQALYLSENLGAGELSAVVEKSSRAFQAWNIAEDEMTGKMDYLFKVSQSTGVGFTELAEKTQKYGAAFQSLGYDFNSASAMIGQLVKSGVDVDSTLAGMRTSLGKLTAQGLSATEGFELYYEKIKNATSETEAMSIASEIFGTKNGALMAKSIRDGKLAVGALTAELTKSTETIEGASNDTMDFAEKMQILKNKMKVSLAPLGNSVFDSLNALMPLAEKGINTLAVVISKFGAKLPDLVPKISKVVNKIIAVFNKILPVVKTIFNKAVEAVRKIIEKLQPIFEKVINKIKPIFENLKNDVIEGVAKGFEKLKVAVNYVRENFDKFSPILAGITASLITYKTITTTVSGVQKAWTGITKAVTVAQKALNVVLNANPIGIVAIAVGALVAGFVALYKNSETFRKGVQDLWDKVKPVFTSLKNAFKEVFKSAKPVFSELGKLLKDVGRQFTTVFSKIAKSVKKVLAPAFKLIKQIVKPIVNGVINDLKLKIEYVANVFKNVSGVITSIFKGDWQGAMDNLKNVVIAPIEFVQARFINIVDTVQNCITAIKEKFPALGGILQGVFDTITPIIEAVKGVFSGLIDFVKNVFTGSWREAWESVKSIFSSIFDGLAGVIKIPLNAVIGVVNKVINSINNVGFTIPDWVPVVGGKAFALNIPEIPTFAKGGIASSPSICGEGGYPEYVITTDPRYRDRNINLLSQAADELQAGSTYITNNANNNGGSVFKIEFAPVINCTGEAKTKDIIQALRERMPEFVDMIQSALENERQGAY